MIGEVISNIVRFVLLMIVQILLINQIQYPSAVNGLINPQLYILFILMIPVYTNKVFMMFLAFLTGLCIDIFSGTAGLHASACLWIAFIRPTLLNLIAPRDGYETTLQLNLRGMGFDKFIIYVGTLVLVHHMWLFSIEAFNFLDFFQIVIRIILSTIATLIFLLISQIITQSKNYAGV